jgi:hypothetical protein
MIKHLGYEWNIPGLPLTPKTLHWTKIQVQETPKRAFSSTKHENWVSSACNSPYINYGYPFISFRI